MIDLNEYEEDQELLDLTFYDRKAVAYWSQEIISDKGLMLSVNGLQDFSLSNTSHFRNYYMMQFTLHLIMI